MRALTTALAASCCAAAIAACGTSQTFQPRHGEHFTFNQKANPGATLSDDASQITTDTVLRHRGAKLQKAEPFPACPGEAGMQTFTIPDAAGPVTLRVAFTQWNGMEKIATYQRPVKAPDDPAAMDALRRSVCTG